MTGHGLKKYLGMFGTMIIAKVIIMSCLKCEFIPYGMCARCNVCGRVDK